LAEGSYDLDVKPDKQSCFGGFSWGCFSGLMASVLLLGPLAKELVAATPVFHGSPQTVDSTGSYTSLIDDFTEHTFSAQAGPVGSFAECPITRKFAAPIKSIKVTIVSGTADDIGYVGGTLVTPNSLGTPHCATVGFVTNQTDVSSQATLWANEATLNLRAQENCCCTTGWGQDTDSSRSNARLHWQVELWPPVPIGPTLSNSVNGHFYALLSPATWTWSERAAVALGGHLVSIANQAEQDWVYNSFSTFAGTNRLLWIGFNDVVSEGRFGWTGGEPVTFTYWAPGEPNNAVGGEDFTAVYEPGHPAAAHWNDFGERVISDNLPIDGVVELVPPMGPPRIVGQPRGFLVNQGASVSLSVAASGSPSLQYQWRHNGVNISGATKSIYSLSNVQFGSSGAYSVIVTNPLGSVTSSNAVLIVNRPPVARCAAKTVSAGADCRGQVSIEAGSSDPDGDPLTILQNPPGPYPIGATTVTLTVSDPHGLSNSCSAIVTVVDRTPPTVVCPADLIRTNDLDQCGALVEFPLPTASDLCSAVGNVTCVPASGSFFPVGVMSVHCAATDSAGNTGECKFILTVRDVQAPTIACASDMVVTNAHNAWTSNVSYGPTATVNCPGDGTPTCSPPSGSAFGLGTNQVTCTVSDAAGNMSQCSFAVTVFPGNQPPMPVIEVSPLAHLPGYTNLIVIAPADALTASVVFNGSKSHDPDDSSFNYYWSEGTNLFSTNVVAERVLGLGAHEISLWLDDTFPLGTNSVLVVVEVISPDDAVGAVIDLLENSNLGRKNLQPLEASLNAAEASFERGNTTAAINQLSAFQNKVRAQIAPFNPQVANELIQAVQVIIDAAHTP